MAAMVQILIKILKFAFYFMLASILALTLWWMTFYVYRHKICVQLPNGLLIGYTALFDRANYLWLPGVNLKLADGTILIWDDIESIYFSKTTVYGTAWPKHRNAKHYDFAYRPDTGLVLGKDDPAAYERLEAQAGKLLRSTRASINTNLLGAYEIFTNEPAYRRQYCPLSIFPESRAEDRQLQSDD